MITMFGNKTRQSGDRKVLQFSAGRRGALHLQLVVLGGTFKII